MGKYEDYLVVSLFQEDLNIVNSFPFENKYKMLKIRKEFERYLTGVSDGGYLTGVSGGGYITTRYQKMFLQTYIHIFTKNLFDSMLYTRKLLNGPQYLRDVPNILFHGTTTISSSDILRKGLLPSEARRNWIEDREKEKKVYLTDSLWNAEVYAFYAVRKSGGDRIIFRVHVEDSKHKMNLGFDPCRPVKAFEVNKEFSTKDPIPPKYIKNFYVFSEDVSLPLRLLTIRNFYSNQ